MAFSRIVLGIKWDMGKYTMEPLPPWAGPISPPFRDPRFREVSKNAGYLDFVVCSSRRKFLRWPGAKQVTVPPAGPA